MRALLHDAIRSDARAQAMLAMLFSRSVPSCDDAISALNEDGLLIGDAVHSLDAAIEQIAQRGWLYFADVARGLAVHPVRRDFKLRRQPVEARHWKLSKFTYLSFDGGQPSVRNPLSDRMILLHDPAKAKLLASFHMARALDDTDAVLIRALIDADMLLPCDPDGTTLDDRGSTHRMWEFHDLLLHSRSRQGRFDGAVGATHRFRDEFPQPEMPPASPAHTGSVFLPEPSGDAFDPPLFATMAGRRSVRNFAETPLTLQQIGAFLHHALRRQPADVSGRYPRSYPNGGACYEQRFFLAIDRVEEMPSGLYGYDDRAHRLDPVAQSCRELEKLFNDAAHSMGLGEPAVASRPPVLVIITSRFGRVGWTYSGLAYALQLKHVGVIQEAMYLSATALGLGGCAIGTGDSDTFAALAGLDYLEEGSVGEFALGVALAE